MIERDERMLVVLMTLNLFDGEIEKAKVLHLTVVLPESFSATET
jgi:hypothetical protein